MKSKIFPILFLLATLGNVFLAVQLRKAHDERDGAFVIARAAIQVAEMYPYNSKLCKQLLGDKK